MVQEGGDGCEKNYSESQSQNSKQDLLFLIKTKDSQVTDSAQRGNFLLLLLVSCWCTMPTRKTQQRRVVYY